MAHGALSFLLLLSPRQANAAGPMVCYGPGGSALSSFLPCFPDRAVTQCCADVGFCLDSGICLDTTGKNGFTEQGCSDPAWGAPCSEFCAVSDGTISYCGVVEPGQPDQYCCGNRTHNCCTESASYFTAPLFSTVDLSPNVLAIQTSAPVTGAPSGTAANTRTNQPGATVTSPSRNSTSSPAASSASYHDDLPIFWSSNS